MPRDLARLAPPAPDLAHRRESDPGGRQALDLVTLYQRWDTARDASMLLYGVPKGHFGRVILT